MVTNDTQAFEALARPERMGQRLRFGESLARHASLRIGGPATVWAEPRSLEELVAVLTAAEQALFPVHIVGLGSNVLFADAGINGVVVRLTGELAERRVLEGDGAQTLVEVGGGTINAHLVRALLRDGLVGAEFLSLIPGTFGGAVAMNAGTQEQEVESILRDVDLLVRRDGRWAVETLDARDLKMRYRHAELPPGAVVLAGRIALEPGEVEAARERMRFDKDRRNRTQPYRLASVGSTFANPPGDFAGRLIEAVGLKGHAEGGARISPLHANFFINEEGATADEFLRLMALARSRVRDRFGVELRPEVCFVGFDGWARMLELEQMWSRSQT